MDHRLHDRLHPLTARRSLLGLLAALAALATLQGLLAAPATARPRTIITFEFDDATLDQGNAVGLFSHYGTPATFFVNSSLIGTPGHFTKEQVLAIAALGYEIGGHTRDHANLPDLTPAQQLDDICGDRTVLQSWGLTVNSFAYPNGKWTPEIQSLVSSCGYASARTVGGVTAPRLCGLGCRPAETFPPTDRLATVTVPAVNSSMTLRTLQRYVRDARRVRRGWVQFVVHHICSCGASNSIAPQTFIDFMAWLRSPKVKRTLSFLDVRSAVALGGAAPPPPPPAPPPPTGP